MYSRVTEELLTTTVTDYYAYLAKTGYMRHDKVCGILALAFVNRFVNSRLSVFVTEDDYRLLSRFLYTLIGRDCLIPWPEYTRQLPQVGGAVRDDIIPPRVDEDGLFRYVQKTPNPRTDDTSYTFWAPVPFRLYASPEGAETSINNESVNMVMCVPGDVVEWRVSKEGYVTQEGSEVVTEAVVRNIRLEENTGPEPVYDVASFIFPICEFDRCDSSDPSEYKFYNVTTPTIMADYVRGGDYRQYSMRDYSSFVSCDGCAGGIAVKVTDFDFSEVVGDMVIDGKESVSLTVDISYYGHDKADDAGCSAWIDDAITVYADGKIESDYMLTD